jgi:hypothetical protein
MERFGQLRVVMAALVLMALADLVAFPGEAVAQTCAKSDFEAVVGSASSTLRDMTAGNTPTFQEKLRALKDKRKWTYEQFVAEAAPLVADDRIAEFDARSVEFLTKINALGSEGAGGAKPDCGLLEKLRADLAALVDTQTQKWAYMFDKLETEMAK